MAGEASAGVQAVAGAAGALCALLSTYPLMTINTRQQTLAAGGGGGRAAGAGGGAGGRAGSSLEEGRRIVAAQGVGGLYSGVRPAIVGTVASNIIYFYLCGHLKKELVRKWRLRGEHELGVAASLCISSLAGCGNVLLTNPLWILVTRSQVAHRARARQAAAGEGEAAPPAEKPSRGGVLKIIQEIYQQYGVPGFWRGTVPNLVMVTNPAIQYMLFEDLKKRFFRATRKSRVGPGEVFFLSALAKIGATLVTYPLLVVKSRIQTRNKNSGQGQADAGVLDTIRQILEREGAGGLYTGMTTKMTQSVFAAALMYMVKEEISDSVVRAAASLRTWRRGGRRALPAAP